MTQEVHQSLVKVGSDDKKALVIVECDVCGRLELEVPIAHLMTLANACAARAQQLGIAARTETAEMVSGFKDCSEADVERTMNAYREKALLN